MNTDTIIAEGIVEILELHFFTGMELACSCGETVQDAADHRYHVAEKIAANIDYWFGLKRFL